MRNLWARCLALRPDLRPAPSGGNRHSCQSAVPPPNYSDMSKCFYITTAIDYVNGEPHLGHAYEKVIADVIARARRSLGAEAFFLTGVDEHGQKVQQAALAQGKSLQVYCDELSVI